MKKVVMVILVIILVIVLAVVGIFIYERAHVSFHAGEDGTSVFCNRGSRWPNIHIYRRKTRRRRDRDIFTDFNERGEGNF